MKLRHYGAPQIGILLLLLLLLLLFLLLQDENGPGEKAKNSNKFFLNNED